MLWLIGMMGSGKTTVGRQVAAKKGLDFVDIDLLVASVTDSSISDLWATEGEGTFRRLESEMIASAAADDDAVIATGGGVVLDADNIARMRSSGLVVWLTASPKSLAARLAEETGRPLLADSDDPTATLADLLAEREHRYAEAAHVQVETDDRPVAEIVQEVLGLWNES